MEFNLGPKCAISRRLCTVLRDEAVLPSILKAKIVLEDESTVSEVRN